MSSPHCVRGLKDELIRLSRSSQEMNMTMRETQLREIPTKMDGDIKVTPRWKSFLLFCTISGVFQPLLTLFSLGVNNFDIYVLALVEKPACIFNRDAQS